MSRVGKTSAFNQYICAMIGSSLSFVDGSCIGWSSAAVLQLEQGGEHMPTGKAGIDTFTSGWIGGAYCIGALVFSPLFGLLADYIGRKRAAYLVEMLFVVHWAMIAFGNNFTWILIARTIGGIGGTGSITINSIYNNEVSEEKHRGMMVSFLALFGACGFLFSYVIGGLFTFHTVAYINLGLSILFLILWFFVPESPVYLVLKGQNDLATKNISWLRGCSESDAIAFVKEIKVQQAEAIKPATIVEFFQDKGARRGLFVIGMVMTIQIFSGVFAVQTYANRVFEIASGAVDPSISSMINGFVMCIGAFLPTLLIERLGRKFLLVGSSFLLFVCNIGMGFYFMSATYGYVNRDHPIVSLLPLIMLYASGVFYYAGLGSVTYVSAVEVFTDENRGVAGALLSTLIWLISFVLLQFFNSAIEILGDYTVFFVFAAVCFFGAIYIKIYLPETKGRNSVDVAAELAGKLT